MWFEQTHLHDLGKAGDKIPVLAKIPHENRPIDRLCGAPAVSGSGLSFTFQSSESVPRAALECLFLKIVFAFHRQSRISSCENQAFCISSFCGFGASVSVFGAKETVASLDINFFLVGKRDL